MGLIFPALRQNISVLDMMNKEILYIYIYDTIFICRKEVIYTYIADNLHLDHVLEESADWATHSKMF